MSDDGIIVAITLWVVIEASSFSAKEKWMTLVSPYPVTVRGNGQPQVRPMEEEPAESVFVKARIDGAETSVTAEVSLGSVGAQELELTPRATNRPTESRGVKIFFSIVCKCNGERPPGAILDRIILPVQRFA